MNKHSQKAIWLQVVDFVRMYPRGVGRLDVAIDFGITKATAIEHLEKAVSRGLIRKAYTWVGPCSRGWIYFDPDIQEDFSLEELSVSRGANHD